MLLSLAAVGQKQQADFGLGSGGRVARTEQAGQMRSLGVVKMQGGIPSPAEQKPILKEFARAPERETDGAGDDVTRPTRGTIEAEIANAVVKFQREQQGRGPGDVRVHLIGELILARCSGIFTPTEARLAVSEEGRRLIRSARQELRSINHAEIENAVASISGVAVVRSYSDVNVEAAEQIEVFVLASDLEKQIVRGVINFFRLGRSIDRILRDNYKSVIAAQNMKDTLERQDSAATFFLAGQTEKARAQYQANWPLFQRAYQIESNNITEPGEQDIANDIGRRFTNYRKKIEALLYANPPMPNAQARTYYFSVLEPDFKRIKQRAQDVLNLNQEAILRANEQAKNEAWRASRVGEAVTAGAFGLAILFAVWATRAALTPLRSLARQAEEIGFGHLNQQILLNRSDEIGALAASFNDMTEKLREARQQEAERLKRAERMSDAALESLYDPVVVTDAEGKIVHLNPAAEGLFGPAQSSRGHAVAQMNEPRLTEAVERAISQERVSAAEDEAGLLTRSHAGTQRSYRLRASPMRDEDGALLGAVAVLEDITHLRELDRLKTEFIGVASHELRTPVTSLLLSVQLMQEGAVGELNADQKELVAAQREDLERLERMMRDLLDITRLEAGMTLPRFAPVPAAQLAEESFEAARSQAEAKDIRLTLDAGADLPAVRADRSQIQRVLLNLLNNAIRHTESGGQVIIAGKKIGNAVEFSVRDTGAGIPPEYLPRIFERFMQVPGATRGGAGLGLSIVQNIIRAHDSVITAESELNRGSRFAFALPVAE
ncbi:uncharacterized protein KY384_000085 [Bacidia gigantensis]|uniref:uncharacterized protein n=1 Tax=Bacidia gigantensis TaxID=2732470 RepID=UPI001D0509FD|nr:uncharacterized protein KY384_000085 [Bacidia gigantensis]KAG8526093.1 hypothetical protein KY384_000085 [Bacidia gigantensis]